MSFNKLWVHITHSYNTKIISLVLSFSLYAYKTFRAKMSKNYLNVFQFYKNLAYTFSLKIRKFVIGQLLQVVYFSRDSIGILFFVCTTRSDVVTLLFLVQVWSSSGVHPSHFYIFQYHRGADDGIVCTEGHRLHIIDVSVRNFKRPYRHTFCYITRRHGVKCVNKPISL